MKDFSLLTKILWLVLGVAAILTIRHRQISGQSRLTASTPKSGGVQWCCFRGREGDSGLFCFASDCSRQLRHRIQWDGW